MGLKFLDFILDLLYPPRCPFCEALLLRNEQGICAKCQEKLPWIVGKNAEQKFEFVSMCVSPLLYQEEVRKSIHRYKFSGLSGYADSYGRLVAQCVEDHLQNRFDVVTWVPISSKRKRIRGYDQAKILAVCTAEHLGFGTEETLRKCKDTAAQSGLKEDAARRANAMGAYEIFDPQRVAGKRVLLIDDVVTTGSTLSECARVLRTHGASDVVCATLARARTQQS